VPDKNKALQYSVPDKNQALQATTILVVWQTFRTLYRPPSTSMGFISNSYVKTTTKLRREFQDDSWLFSHEIIIVTCSDDRWPMEMTRWLHTLSLPLPARHLLSYWELLGTVLNNVVTDLLLLGFLQEASPTSRLISGWSWNFNRADKINYVTIHKL
jgi:hypothetical protein